MINHIFWKIAPLCISGKAALFFRCFIDVRHAADFGTPHREHVDFHGIRYRVQYPVCGPRDNHCRLRVTSPERMANVQQYLCLFISKPRVPRLHAATSHGAGKRTKKRCSVGGCNCNKGCASTAMAPQDRMIRMVCNASGFCVG